MYRDRLNDGLKSDELEAARLGFNRYLRRKRFSPQFISRNAEELFAQATLEYSRKCAEGVEIDNPPGWLIECAWRRTKSQLEAEARNPRLIALEKGGPLAAKPDDEPEDALLESERYRKLWEAVGKLSADQRRVLALSYFEGFTVREAGRRLRWHSSKAQRAHEGAKERLHELLGVESVDDLVIEIGLVAYLSLAGRAAGSIQLPAGLEAMAESAHDSAKQLWARAHELLGRLTTGGGGGGIEAAGAAATDGGGRIAEACKVLVVCVVGGTAALGGNQLINHEGQQPPPTPNRAAPHATSADPLPTSAAGRTGSLGGTSSGAAAPAQSGAHQGSESAGGPDAKRRSAERQAEAQFGGVAKAGGAEPRAETTASVSSASSSPPPSEASTATGSQAAPAEERQASKQFGAFK